MTEANQTPLDRAGAKREHIERQRKKCPDFQLYLLTNGRSDRLRMERLLDKIPSFRLWRALTGGIGTSPSPRRRTLATSRNF